MKKSLVNWYEKTTTQNFILISSAVEDTESNFDAYIEEKATRYGEGILREAIKIDGYNINDEVYLIEIYDLIDPVEFPEYRSNREAPIEEIEEAEIDLTKYNRFKIFFCYDDGGQYDDEDVKSVLRGNNFFIRHIYIYNWGASYISISILLGFSTSFIASVVWHFVLYLFHRRRRPKYKIKTKLIRKHICENYSVKDKDIVLLKMNKDRSYFDFLFKVGRKKIHVKTDKNQSIIESGIVK